MKNSVLLIGSFALFSSVSYSDEKLDRLYTNHIKNKFVFQAGFTGSYQGKNQKVLINSLIGDQFTVTDKSDINALIGLGYYLDGKQYDKFKIQYGIDVMYLMPTYVNGQVIQEELFNNLSYSYKVTNVPIYAAIKAITDTPKKGYQLYFDGGIGPNIMSISNFHEQPLNTFTLPEQLYTSSTKATFSAMAGVGIRATDILQRPLECGYRFMYLGQSQLAINNSEVVNNLSTGQNYSHSLVCGLTF